MISVISVLLPLVVALTLVYPLGETMAQDLVLGMVGGYVGYLAIYVVDLFRGAVRLHEGAVCINGRHLRRTFIFLLGVPATVAALAGTLTFNAVPTVWALVPAVFVYAIAYAAANMGWRQLTGAMWEEQWEIFVEATTSGPNPNEPKPLRSINAHIDYLFATGGMATNVREFEMLLMQALIFRGFAIGLEDAEAVGRIFLEMALEGEERAAWLNRGLNEEVWKEIGPVYGRFAHEVRGEQHKQLQGTEDQKKND